MFRVVMCFFCALLLSSCAGKSVNDFRVSLGLESAFDVVQKEFKQGLVVEARTRVLAMKKGDKDYENGQTFLKDTIEPARLKLLRYYARKGKAEEQKGNWASAEESYRTASELSTQPQALKAYQRNMELKVRQQRFDVSYKQREMEDVLLISALGAYLPPKGLYPDDTVLTKALEGAQADLDARATQSWKYAQDYQKKDIPELAWLYADSYLRLSSGSKEGEDLRNAMATAIPKGFKMPDERVVKPSAAKANAVKTKTEKSERSAAEPDVSSASVKALMNGNKWIEAKREAQKLSKIDVKQARKLKEEIDANMSSLAEDAYAKGNLAFRSEDIDKAVEFWQQAVNLLPNQQTYVDSLHRGKQIQERLKALKSEAEE